MSVEATGEKLVQGPCLWAETVDTMVWEFWQHVLASVVAVQKYLAPV